MGVKLLHCDSVRLLANNAELRVNMLFEKSLFKLGLFWHRCNWHRNNASFFDAKELMLFHSPSIALLHIVKELDLAQKSLILLNCPTKAKCVLLSLVEMMLMLIEAILR